MYQESAECWQKRAGDLWRLLSPVAGPQVVFAGFQGWLETFGGLYNALVSSPQSSADQFANCFWLL